MQEADREDPARILRLTGNQPGTACDVHGTTGSFLATIARNLLLYPILVPTFGQIGLSGPPRTDADLLFMAGFTEKRPSCKNTRTFVRQREPQSSSPRFPRLREGFVCYYSNGVCSIFTNSGTQISEAQEAVKEWFPRKD